MLASAAAPASLSEQPTDFIAAGVRACQFGELTKLQDLVQGRNGELRLRVNQKDGEGISFLHWASINNRLDVVKYLLSEGADATAPGGVLQETPLQWAARQGHIEVVIELLAAGCDPLHANTYGQNALHLACQLERLPVLLLLLAHDVPVNSLDAKGFTPLMYAAKLRGNNTDMLRALLAYGAGTAIGAADTEEGNTALHWSVQSNFGPDALLGLLKAGADCDATNKLGYTPQVSAYDLARDTSQYYRTVLLESR
jgi:palmitoyltransferase ZDHHC13/17